MKILKIILIILSVFVGLWFLIILSNNKTERTVGRIKIEGDLNAYVDIYQSVEFDMVTEIYGNIVNAEDSIISLSKTIFNSHEPKESITLFHAFSYDSIIYITYENTDNVVEIYNLKNSIQEQYNMNTTEMSKHEDSLFYILKSLNPKLNKGRGF